MPNFYIIAGCNGAGKTTASFTILPDILGCREFINADAIAYGLSPFNVDGVAIAAGRIMLQRIASLLDEGVDFAIETTLATRTYVNVLNRAFIMGYKVTILFMWLRSPEVAIDRIAERVQKGGHHIPDDIVKRRYTRGLKNFFNLFMPVCDAWLLVDNSYDEPGIIATGEKNLDYMVENEEIWQTIANQVHGA